MVWVLRVAGAVFLLAGLIVCVVYLGNQAVVLVDRRAWWEVGSEVFLYGAAASAAGMITLALLEVQRAVAALAEEPSPPAGAGASAPGSAKPANPKQRDVRTSFLDVQERD